MGLVWHQFCFFNHCWCCQVCVRGSRFPCKYYLTHVFLCTTFGKALTLVKVGNSFSILLGTLNTWSRSSHWITERRERHISQTEFIAHQLTGWELKRVSMILELKLTRLTSVIDICGQARHNTEFYGESWMGKEWLEMPAPVLPWKFCCFLSFSFKSIKQKKAMGFCNFSDFSEPNAFWQNAFV